MSQTAPVATSPRVQAASLPTHSPPSAAVPRVPIPLIQYKPTSVLQQHSKILKYERFNNTTTHRYPIRSKVTRSANHKPSNNFHHLASQKIVSQHMFQHINHHIYRPNGTKQTIDSMFAVPQKKNMDTKS